MRLDVKDRLRTLRQKLGANTAPTEITQRDFEDGPEHLHRLAHVQPEEQPDGRDLCEYMLDLKYTDIQTTLLVYLIPFCLEYWHRILCSDNLEFPVDYPGFVDDFYPVLVNREVFERHLTAAQGEAVLDFMRDSILEEIDAQEGLFHKGYWVRPRRWIGALTTYGVVGTDIEQLWTTWWAVETTGRAVATVQYISCLMYPKDRNPIFAPYTREKGGGPPCLWSFDGFLNDNFWRQANVDFLQGLLSAPGVVNDVLARATDRLIGHQEHEIASRVLADLPSCAAMLSDRCSILPLLLATPESDMQAKWWEWPE